MKTALLKKVFCLLGMLVMAFSYSTVGLSRTIGGDSGGGGDATEMTVDAIRSDLLNWIRNAGARGLKLPDDISYDDYVLKMTDILQPKKVVIGFIDKDDESNDELKVNVDGIPKTCRGFISVLDLKPHILCNISRFKNTLEFEQYRLIHHEYAGLVNMEKNENAASDYSISSQITDFLTEQTVYKLSIKKRPKPPVQKMAIAGGMLKSHNVGSIDFFLRLECIEENPKNLCTRVRFFSNISPGTSTFTFALTPENLKKIEATTLSSKLISLHSRYLKLGTYVIDGTNDLMIGVFGDSRTNMELALSAIPGVAGLAVDLVKSPVIISSYFVAKLEARRRIQNYIKFLLNHDKWGTEIKISDEDILTLREGFYSVHDENDDNDE